MRQLFLDKGALVVKRVAEPLLGDDMVLVAVHYSCINAESDAITVAQAQSELLHNIPHKIKKVLTCITAYGAQRTKSLIKNRVQGDLQPFGYACSGRVIAVGRNVHGFRTGDLVACSGAHMAHHADIVCVPEYAITRIKQESHLKAASMTAIGVIALHSIRRAQLQLGECVCVFGLDLIGQLLLQLAKSSGCTVLGVDTRKDRLEKARELGADYLYHATEDKVVDEIAFLTQQHGVDVSFVASLTERDFFVEQAITSTRKQGRVVALGARSTLHVQQRVMQKKEIDLLVSCASGIESDGTSLRWTQQENMQTFVRLLEVGQLTIDPLISSECTLEEHDRLTQELRDEKNISMVICYTPHEIENSWQEKRTACPLAEQEAGRFVPAIKQRNKEIRLGVIGAGRFSKLTLLPLIDGMKGVRVEAVADVDAVRAINCARLHKIPHAISDEDELYAHEDINAVLVVSPHVHHAQQALKALHYGKAVFIGKPMVTSYEQFEAIKPFLARATTPLCVGYNYAFSPFMHKIKNVIHKRHTPLSLHYRVNTGTIDKEYWLKSGRDTGRIIGNACSIIDLFCYLIDSKPVAVSVEALHAAKYGIFPTDNATVQISFEDGSICSLLFTSIGHKELGKDRMELFFDGKSIVMNDYRQLHGFGLPTLFNEAVSAPDRGHEALLRAFFDELKKPKFTPPIPFERLKTVAELTLLIDQLACVGGGSHEITPVTKITPASYDQAQM